MGGRFPPPRPLVRPSRLCRARRSADPRRPAPAGRCYAMSTRPAAALCAARTSCVKPGPHRTRRCSGPVCDRPSASRRVPARQNRRQAPLEAVLTGRNGPGHARTVANRAGTAPTDAVRTGLQSRRFVIAATLVTDRIRGYESAVWPDSLALYCRSDGDTFTADGTGVAGGVCWSVHAAATHPD